MENNTGKTLALIVARSGDLRDGLYSLLTVIDEIDSVIQVDSARSAIPLMEEQSPGLVILDFDLPRGAAASPGGRSETSFARRWHSPSVWMR